MRRINLEFKIKSIRWRGGRFCSSCKKISAMDDQDTSVTCAVNVDYQNSQGSSIRKVNYRLATLRLIRNDSREMFIEVSTDKAPTAVRLQMRDIQVHKKFMAEGKASIKFNRDKCMLYLSNAPPGLLINFLRLLFVKLTVGSDDTADAAIEKNIRAKMLSREPSQFQVISPMTNLEINRAAKLSGHSRATPTTPSPSGKKRKFERTNDGNDGTKQNNPPKKLNTEVDAVIEPIIKLNDEQNQVLKACIDGKNTFFTGSAGTGKSYLLKKIISVLPPDGTVATASTGVAACLIGGVTLHSFAGIGTGDMSLARCKEIASRPASAQAWRKCKRLIIDEISMVDGEFFEKIEAVARHIRRNEKPFGGIQLILCGDFFQLPPVVKSNTKSASQNAAQSKRFCFQTETWQTVISCTFELKMVHRQKDSEFVRILNFIRVGHVNDEIVKRLTATSKQKIEKNGILATQLCSHTNDANLINNSKLQKLPGEERIFDAQDSESAYSKQLDNMVMAPGKLALKVGAQVMLLKNINIAEGLVNGARGVVIGFTSATGPPIVKFKNNREYIAKSEKWIMKTPSGGVITRKQIALKLAWAFSIHKSQGLTLDCVEMSLSKVFEAGQAYVALSRAQSLECVRIIDFDMKQVWADPDVLCFYKMFRRQLHDNTMIALGKPRPTLKKSISMDGKRVLPKSLMSKPLVNIC